MFYPTEETKKNIERISREEGISSEGILSFVASIGLAVYEKYRNDDHTVFRITRKTVDENLRTFRKNNPRV